MMRGTNFIPRTCIKILLTQCLVIPNFLLDIRDGATPAAPAPKTSSPPVSTSPSQATTAVGPSTSPPANKEVDAFDEFDLRGPVSGMENPRDLSVCQYVQLESKQFACAC